eukprot:CAMPEP_0184494328 /NCGR_PEP_ID=MMETSP0113_2-20130426/28436_1 /TAXON_ID=91329 /ORGANISM="Norrisiella sphaerica, Strain BC52" /LENGTH=501 /DNA_ID=CAMNT_0026880047 /DNA_START=227 /DNA_END=1733 /DNA_ORIENTATION=+
MGPGELRIFLFLYFQRTQSLLSLAWNSCAASRTSKPVLSLVTPGRQLAFAPFSKNNRNIDDRISSSFESRWLRVPWRRSLWGIKARDPSPEEPPNLEPYDAAGAHPQEYIDEDSEEDDQEKLSLLLEEPFGRITSTIRETDNVFIYPSFAFKKVCKRTGKVRWASRIHGRAIDSSKRHRRRRVGMSSAARTLGCHPSNEAERAMYRKRMDLFTHRAARQRWVGIDMGLGVWWTLTQSNGHFITDLQISEEGLPENIPDHGPPITREVSTLPLEDGRSWDTHMFFIPASGISIISDIDDTIKLTEVKNSKKMLCNTFLYEFAAVDGMSQLYKYFEQRGAAFHYVSNSPWQLQPELEAFLKKAGFPDGTYHLKHLKFQFNKPITFLKNRLLRSKPDNKTNHKHSTIMSLLQAFPERQFILVGDSGEKDPKIYADIAQKFPRQINRVYIRRVNGDNREGKHWEKVFAGLGSEKWQVFDSLSSIMEDAKGAFSEDLRHQAHHKAI